MFSRLPVAFNNIVCDSKYRREEEMNVESQKTEITRKLLELREKLLEFGLPQEAFDLLIEREALEGGDETCEMIPYRQMKSAS
ncbi:hypothetical protein ACFL54_04115 [Planctomycetota bacterium]